MKTDLKRFKERRRTLMDTLYADAGERHAVALYFSGEQPALDPYRVDSDFFYLTGLDVPGSALLFVLSPESKQEILLLPPSDPQQKRWTGDVLAAGGLTESARADAARRRASSKSGFKEIAPLYKLNALLARPLASTDVVYLDLPARGEGLSSDRAMKLAEELKRELPHIEIRHGGRFVAALRRVKDSAEIALMEEAAGITDEAHRSILRHLEAGLYEYEIQAVLEYVFKAAGAQELAFPSIVGSGPNSCILHYESNIRRMKKGDMVVCDIGCRKDFYCADETRTYPVSGKYTKRQAEVYDAVLEAHDAALAVAKPGVMVKDVHHAAFASLKKAGFADYFYHGTSHYLGIDAHDAGSYDESLAEGVVITIEPGVYIAKEEIGVRIEDDVLITKTGARLLSKAPRTRREIEKALSAPRKKTVI